MYGMYGYDCNFCATYRKPPTSGKAHYVAGIDRKGTHRRVRCIETGEVFSGQAEARRVLVTRDNLTMGNASNIADVCNGKRKTCGGYTWEFVPNPTPLPLKNQSRRFGPILSIEKSWRTARKAIGREDVRFHDLRHSIATWLTRGGTPLGAVSEMLGHRDITTTQRYAHVAPKTVATFLNDVVSIDIPTNPERNGNNSPSQSHPNQSVPSLFDHSNGLTG